jgi:hypothetical protein
VTAGSAGADPAIRGIRCGDGDVNEPQVNVDHFCHRAVYTVVGMLTDKSQTLAIASELGSAGVDANDVGYFGPGTFEQFPILDTG